MSRSTSLNPEDAVRLQPSRWRWRSVPFGALARSGAQASRAARGRSRRSPLGRCAPRWVRDALAWLPVITLSAGLNWLASNARAQEAATATPPAAPTQSGSSKCNPSDDVRLALSENGLTKGRSIASADAAKAYDAFLKLLERFPEDVFVNREFQNLVRTVYRVKLQDAINRYHTRMIQRPNDPTRLYLYGRILNPDESEAANAFQKSFIRGPNFPWAHLALTYVNARKSPPDLDAAKNHLTRFWELCPGTLEGYGYLKQLNDPEMTQAAAQRLRTLLDARHDAEAITARLTLWELEFNLTPPEGEDSLRAQIHADLESLRSRDLPADKEAFDAIRRGYEMAGDVDGAAWVDERVALTFPASREALTYTIQQWNKVHPEPGDGAEPNDVLAHYDQLLKATDDWVRRWPDSPDPWLNRLEAIRWGSPASDGEVRRATKELLATWRKKPVLHTFPRTVPLLVAEVLLLKKLDLETIPELVQEGIAAGEKRGREDLASGVEDPVGRKNAERGIEIIRWHGWIIQFDAYCERKEPAKAREVIGSMKELLRRAETDWTDDRELLRVLRGAFWSRLARLSELEGKKLDALAFYQNAVVLGPVEPKFYSDKQARAAQIEQAKALWQQLGGTPDAWQRWLESRGAQDAATAPRLNAWEAVQKPIADFQLQDTSGKSWSLSALRGHLLFITVWATWSPPCKLELAQVQQLQEQLGARSDVVLLTLNADVDIAAVDPYMRANGFSFPALLAESYVKRLLGDGLTLPQSWIVDETGVVRWRRVGFTEDKDWVRTALELLDRTGD